MHRSPAASTAAGLAGEELRHELARRHAFGERLAMTAMGDRDPVVGPKRRRGPDGAGFLAEGEVDRPGDPTLQEELVDPLLELPDKRHSCVQLDGEGNPNLAEIDRAIQVDSGRPGVGPKVSLDHFAAPSSEFVSLPAEGVLYLSSAV